MGNIELNNKLFGHNSLCIILNQYKKEHITEEEAVQLIEDLYKNTGITYILSTLPQITYEQPQYQHFEVTCKQ